MVPLSSMYALVQLWTHTVSRSPKAQSLLSTSSIYRIPRVFGLIAGLSGVEGCLMTHFLKQIFASEVIERACYKLLLFRSGITCVIFFLLKKLFNVINRTENCRAWITECWYFLTSQENAFSWRNLADWRYHQGIRRQGKCLIAINDVKKGANQAIASAKLGAETVMLG